MQNYRKNFLNKLQGFQFQKVDESCSKKIGDLEYDLRMKMKFVKVYFDVKNRLPLDMVMKFKGMFFLLF